MKRKISMLLLSVLLVPVISTGFVAAVETTSNGEEQPTTQNETTDVSTTAAENKVKTLEERLKERKEALQTKLTALEQKRIESKCKLAQTPLKALTERANGISTSRDKIHSGLLDKLNNLVERLKAADIDTAELEKQITELKTKITTFQTDLESYKQALSDLASMDCAKDPAAFKASLEAARTLRETLVADSAAIRSYFTDTMKPTLQAIKEQLAAKKSEQEGGTN